MIRMLGKILFLLVAVCMLAVPGFTQTGVRLQYKFTPNEVLRYQIGMNGNIDIQMNIMGADQVPSITMAMTGIMRQRTMRVLQDGSAEIRVAFESLRMTAAGSEIPLDVNSMPAVTMVMTPSGQVKSAKGLELMPQAFGGMPFMNMGSIVQESAFPKTALKVGDTWTQNVPFPLGGILKVNGKLVNANASEAVIRQTISGNIAISSMLPQSSGTTADAKGTSTFDVMLRFSTEKGRLISASGTGVMPLSISAFDTQGDMGADVRMNISMALIP